MWATNLASGRGKKCLPAYDKSVCDKQVVHYAVHIHSNLESSLVGVTQPLVSSVHQLIDGILVHNTIRLDRRRELRGSSLIGHVLVKRPRTSKKGGAPFGNAGSGTRFTTMAVAPPANDQKLASLAFCQSYQILSTIWGRGYVRKLDYSHLFPLLRGAS